MKNLTSEDYLADKLAGRLHGFTLDRTDNKWYRCENPKIGYTYLDMKNWLIETVDNVKGWPPLREENFKEWKARNEDTSSN